MPEFLKAKSSAVLIQAGFRGALARGGLDAQRAAAKMFQSAFRGRKARQHLAGVLTVTVLRGIKLADRELFGKQDPYVILKLMNNSGTSCDCVVWEWFTCHGGHGAVIVTVLLGCCDWLCDR